MTTRAAAAESKVLRRFRGTSFVIKVSEGYLPSLRLPDEARLSFASWADWLKSANADSNRDEDDPIGSPYERRLASPSRSNARPQRGFTQDSCVVRGISQTAYCATYSRSPHGNARVSAHFAHTGTAKRTQRRAEQGKFSRLLAVHLRWGSSDSQLTGRALQKSGWSALGKPIHASL
jgi:hypothetical protein